VNDTFEVLGSQGLENNTVKKAPLYIQVAVVMAGQAYLAVADNVEAPSFAAEALAVADNVEVPSFAAEALAVQTHQKQMERTD
jgi:hypothetical protein